jgi:putative ABC transport system substrate-binding protein
MKRREFIAGLGSAAAWPVVARAQDARPPPLIGVLMAPAADQDQHASLDAFLQTLKQLGWVEGRNVRFDIRWGAARVTETRKHAVELAALAPDIIFASGIASLESLLRETRAIPIVFCNLADPVGAGLVNSLARPGGNATGFIQFEYTLSAKWLELLMQIAPGLVRVAVLRDAEITSGVGQFAVVQSVASGLGVEVSAINMSDSGEIERGIDSFAQSPNGGLILTTGAKAVVHRDLISRLPPGINCP